MSGKTAKLLRKYAILHRPQGSSVIMRGRTVEYDGRIRFYRTLKKRLGIQFSIQEIKNELRQAGVLHA